MKLSQLVGIIKALLPSNSPWISRIDQAAKMAQNFNPSKDGVSQLMEAYGKNKSDLQKAVGMLENPMVKNALSRVPGLGNILKGAANELMTDSDINSGHVANIQNCNADNTSNGSFESLRARLNHLK